MEPPITFNELQLCQFALAVTDHDTREPMWLCDLSFEHHRDTAYLIGGRLDREVAERLRRAKFIVVTNEPLTSPQPKDGCHLQLPNDRDSWSNIPGIG